MTSSLGEESELKTWPATPVGSALESAVRSCLELVGVASGKTEAAGVGQPFEEFVILDLRFLIG
jgi:hypothetical protein